MEKLDMLKLFNMGNYSTGMGGKRGYRKMMEGVNPTMIYCKNFCKYQNVSKYNNLKKIFSVPLKCLSYYSPYYIALEERTLKRKGCLTLAYIFPQTSRLEFLRYPTKTSISK
jgi:hypothetical protein